MTLSCQSSAGLTLSIEKCVGSDVTAIIPVTLSVFLFVCFTFLKGSRCMTSVDSSAIIQVHVKEHDVVLHSTTNLETTLNQHVQKTDAQNWTE